MIPESSDSPFVELVWRCHSEGAAPFLSIASTNCELVLTKLHGQFSMTVRGPESRALPMGDCPGDGEWLGIILKLGAFLPELPTRGGGGGGERERERADWWMSQSPRHFRDIFLVL